MATPRIPPKFYKKVNHTPRYATDPRNVNFKEIKPMALKDQLTGKDSSSKRTPCVGHMLDMLDCLKRTGFMDGPCKQQILAFTKCNEDYKKTEMVQEGKAEDDITYFKSTKAMKREQLNVLLKRFDTKS